MELNRCWVVVFVLFSCAHQQKHPLKFYHIAKDIQHGANLEGNSIDHDLHIPPQTKNIAIVLSQRHSHYHDLRYGFKIFLQQQTNQANLHLRVLRGKHQIARLTRALHKRQVHGIITDLPRTQMRNFMTICHDYHVPILYLAPRHEEDSYLLHSIYPNFRYLVRKAVSEMQRRGFKHIAMLNSTNNSNVQHHVKRYAGTAGLRFKVASYQRDDFDSMSRAVRRLFDVQEETVDTAEEGKTEVVYRQLRKFDAVFLPDDFKILKYFVKLFKYYMLAEMPVVGLHHWRSPQQVVDKNLLQEGFYIDFIGSYDKLPPGLSTSTNPTNLTAIKRIDQRLLGYRGLAWLVQAIDATRRAIRTNLNNRYTQAWTKRLARRFSRAKNKLWQAQVINIATHTASQPDFDKH